LLSLWILLAACQPIPSMPPPSMEPPPSPSPTLTVTAPVATQTASTTEQAAATSAPPTVTPLPTALNLDPENWMDWPEIPVVTSEMRTVYERGLALGNNPQAFSILGDCQSTPETFLGVYADEEKFAALSPELQETARYFSAVLGRNSPTSKSGSTSGALLWPEWHEGKYGCGVDESPLACELRVNTPSFALVMIGTHWEARNERYMRKIIEQLLEAGVVPILATKADNREGDHGINLETATLAAEYGLPLWNFYPVTAGLDNRGLYTKKGEEYLGDIYLTDEALTLHRYSALEALDAVWRVVVGE
jgi:hypothetical protein